MDFQRVWTDEDGMQRSEPASAAMLVHAITLHFIGNPKEEQASAKSVLINLRCPTLSDYRWYKDFFYKCFKKRRWACRLLEGTLYCRPSQIIW